MLLNFVFGPLVIAGFSLHLYHRKDQISMKKLFFKTGKVM